MELDLDVFRILLVGELRRLQITPVRVVVIVPKSDFRVVHLVHLFKRKMDARPDVAQEDVGAIITDLKSDEAPAHVFLFDPAVSQIHSFNGGWDRLFPPPVQKERVLAAAE